MPVGVPLRNDFIGVFCLQRLIDLLVCIFGADKKALRCRAGNRLVKNSLNPAGSVPIAEYLLCIIDSCVDNADQDALSSQIQIGLALDPDDAGGLQGRTVQQPQND